MKINVELTKNPKEKPDPGILGFGKFFSDHMFTLDYEEGTGWHNPSIIPYGPLALDPSSMVFHYGQAVFEGMKCYRTADGRLLLFRPELNFMRLNRSDERLCIPAINTDKAIEALCELIKIEKDWVPQADGTSLYIRPFVIATDPFIGVRPSSKYKFLIILSPVGSYYPEGINPVKIFVEDDYVRSVRGGVGFTKASANYAISLKGQEKAKKEGYTQVLWLDAIDRKYIEEVGTMNVFFHIDGELVTPSLDNDSILPGVTRDSVVELAKSWGMKVSERKISIDEVFDAHNKGKLSEAFGSGTAAVVSPIGELNRGGHKIYLSDGKTGPLAAKLYEKLTAIQYGREADTFGWTKEIK
ncbi:MAG: branched-chain amino acid aminotransferase [Defluviitaleaceae bacterium]|nr:branched-chain amino acid aminotransferase [Defluviitaleaceae bacterium]